MKEQCNLDILQEIMGLQSDEKIVVKFIWLTTLMLPLSKIFGLKPNKKILWFFEIIWAET